MSGPFGAGALQYFSGAKSFYDYEIDQSLRFNDDDSAYLEKTFSTSGNAKTFTISFWFKRCRDGTAEYLFAGGQSVNDRFHMDINASGTFQIEAKNSGSTVIKMEGGPVLRDLGAWYHFVLRVDTTQATASDRVRLYVNGELLTFNSNTYPPQNENLNWNVNDQVRIGRAGWATNYFDGYFTEFINVDGSSLAPTSFGETKEGIWIPKEYTGSYGTNGFKLAFQDSSALGDDTSGNGHDFTANNFAASDQMPDSPTNNRPVFNALLSDVRYTTTVSDGNKTINFTAGNDGFSCCPMTIFRNEGKAYCEFELDTAGSGNATDNQAVCVFEAEADIPGIGGGGNSALAAAYNSGSSGNNAVIYDDGVSQGNPTKFTTAGQRIGVYIDYDAGKGWFSHEGTVQSVNGTPDVSAGTNPHFTFTANTPLTVGAGGIHSSGTPAKITVYDHPDDWETTPSGYTAFATAELPDPGIDPNADENPADYFNTVLYTGNETARSITGVGWQPDCVWIKRRSSAFAHNLYDVVRGAGNHLVSNNSAAESTTTTRLTAFESDGFALGTGTALNQTSETYVAWNWKAGGTAASNTDGSVTSSVSASSESGFSIVTYTGPGSGGGTIGHGLGKAPSMIIVKNRSSAENWRVYHSGLTATKYLNLNTDGAAVTSSAVWADTEPTASVFSVANDAAVSGSGNSLVAYCFADIDGMVKAGSFTGTGDSDGPFIYTGFRPAWIMVKITTSADNWIILDTARDTFNTAEDLLRPNASDAEGTEAGAKGDFVSNGFKMRGSGAGEGQANKDGATYIYLAFAEQPFKYANAR